MQLLIGHGATCLCFDGIHMRKVSLTYCIYMDPNTVSISKETFLVVGYWYWLTWLHQKFSAPSDCKCCFKAKGDCISTISISMNARSCGKCSSPVAVRSVVKIVSFDLKAQSFSTKSVTPDLVSYKAFANYEEQGICLLKEDAPPRRSCRCCQASWPGFEKTELSVRKNLWVLHRKHKGYNLLKTSCREGKLSLSLPSKKNNWNVKCCWCLISVLSPHLDLILLSVKFVLKVVF